MTPFFWLLRRAAAGGDACAGTAFSFLYAEMGKEDDDVGASNGCCTLDRTAGARPAQLFGRRAGAYQPPKYILSHHRITTNLLVNERDTSEVIRSSSVFPAGRSKEGSININKIQ